mmetsp:Transcript_22179/g.48099  ORF Transcript_22179/g.48099 Transcript_22179/m.48099 type:complete len:201 (+) Transcript_22179:1004-1606(+)
MKDFFLVGQPQVRYHVCAKSSNSRSVQLLHFKQKHPTFGTNVFAVVIESTRSQRDECGCGEIFHFDCCLSRTWLFLKVCEFHHLKCQSMFVFVQIVRIDNTPLVRCIHDPQRIKLFWDWWCPAEVSIYLEYIITSNLFYPFLLDIKSTQVSFHLALYSGFFFFSFHRLSFFGSHSVIIQIALVHFQLAGNNDGEQWMIAS